MKHTNTYGLTTLQILGVVLLLGIIVALLIPRLLMRSDSLRIEKAQKDIVMLVTELNLYKQDNGFYPSTQQGLHALEQRPNNNPKPQNWKVGGYLKRLPLDPWGHTYKYLSPGVINKGSFDVFSYGPSGKPGGTGENAMIGNWPQSTNH